MKTGRLLPLFSSSLPLSALVLTVYYYSPVTISRTFEASLGTESRITSNILLRSKRKHGLVLNVYRVCFKSPSDDLVVLQDLVTAIIVRPQTLAVVVEPHSHNKNGVIA